MKIDQRDEIARRPVQLRAQGTDFESLRPYIGGGDPRNACDLKRRRRLAIESMRAKGILVMETDPAHLSIQLVQRYLEIRQADLQ